MADTSFFFPDNTGGTMYVDNTATVDNIWVFAKGSDKVRRQADGVYRIAWRVGNNPTGDQTARVQGVLDHSTVKDVVFDKGPVQIDGTLTVPDGKTLVFKNGCKLTGTGTIIVYLKDLKYNIERIFADSLTVKILSHGELVHPEIFGAKANDPAFDNAPAFNKLFKSFYNGPDPAAAGQYGSVSLRIKLAGTYFIQDTIFIRNCTPIMEGNGSINGTNFIAGGDMTSRRTVSSIATGAHYTINQYRIFAHPVGNLTITIPTLTPGTVVHFSIADREWSGFKTAIKRGSFTYTGADTVMFRDYRSSYSETIHLSTSYIAYNAIDFEYGSTGPAGYQTSLVNQCGHQVTSIKFSGLELLSAPANNNTHTVAATPAYGPLPPYSVKVTMTGVSNGTTLYCTRIIDGVVAGSATFTYSGADTVIHTNYTPGILTPTKTRNEWFVIGTAAAPAEAVNGKWAVYGNSVGIINNVASSTITSWKFNDDNQMSKYFWQDRSMFNISGCDNLEMRDFTLKASASLNPIQTPFSGIYTYIDVTNPDVAVRTQRQHIYHSIHFQNYTFPESGQWQKYRSFFANYACDGAFGNNDFFKFYHVNFSQAQYCVFNDNQQSVAHTLSECYWNQCDWCVASMAGMLSIDKAFVEFGTCLGFAKVIGTSNESISYQLYDFNTEGIAGWFFIYGWGGAALNVDLYSPQPVFWNNFGGTTREFYLLACSQVTQVKFVSGGGNWIMGNGGGAGLAKIRAGSTNLSGTCSIAIRNAFFYPNSLGSLAIEVPDSSFMLELNTHSGSYAQGYSGHIFRGWISQFQEVWTKYQAIDPANGGYMNLATLMANGSTDLQSNCTGTKWIDIGQSGRWATLGFASESFWARIASATVGEVSYAGKIPGGKNIIGLGVKNAHAGLVFDTSSDNAAIFNYGYMYVGDRFDYKKFGGLSTGTQGQKNDNPLVDVFYASNEALLLTGVYKTPSGTSGTLASSGNLTASASLFGNNSNSIDSIIGRKIWITSGAYEGLQGTITGRVSNTVITTSFSGITITTPFSFEIEGKFNPSPSTSVMSFLVSFHYAEANRNAMAVQYLEQNIPQL
jgi:hypothetical protein